jgi:tripeptidyl-peptidase I
MKLGLQGVSLIISSGDRGVSEDLGCLGPNATIFSPTYPGKYVYVDYNDLVPLHPLMCLRN